MKTTKIFLILALLSCIGCSVQTPRSNSLLVAEYEKNYEGVGNYTHLVSYNFIDGKLASRDIILSAPTRKGPDKDSYVKYDFGHNLIYKNRYVISANGNVIDTHTKSLVMEESDDLIDTRGDSLIFHRDNIKTGTSYLICDLKTKSYGFVKDKNFIIVKGLRSPNHLWGIETDKSENPYKIILYNQNNQGEIIITNCRNGTLLSNYSSHWPDVPICWIDNQNFLYATYNPSGCWITSGFLKDGVVSTVTIYKVNIQTKQSESVAKIDSVSPAISTSSFSMDTENMIIFNCEKGRFVVDINKKEATPISMSSVGDDFTIEYNRNEEYGSIIEFQNKEIGRVWCNNYDAKTTTEFIGVEYGDVGSNLGYPKGVSVWNDITKQWTDIEIPWVSSIIGWIEKK